MFPYWNMFPWERTHSFNGTLPKRLVLQEITSCVSSSSCSCSASWLEGNFSTLRSEVRDWNPEPTEAAVKYHFKGNAAERSCQS